MKFFKELKYIEACRQELIGRDDITWTSSDGETLTNDEMLEIMAEDAAEMTLEKTYFYGTREEYEEHIKNLTQQNND